MRPPGPVRASVREAVSRSKRRKDVDYQDFEILIRPDRDDRYSVNVLSSPAGQGSGFFKIPDVLARARDQESEAWPKALVRELVSLGRARSPAQGIGDQLFDALFRGDVRDLFLKSLGHIGTAPNRGLRIKVRYNLNEKESIRIHNLPWELLRFAQTQSFLGLSRLAPIVRSLDLPQSILTPSPTSRPRILMIAPTVTDLQPLNLEREQRQLERIWSKYGIEATLLNPATRQALHDILLKREFNVIHFMGHGDFDTRTGKGGLYLTATTGQEELITGDALAVEIQDACPDLRFVFLNACCGANIDERGLNPFAGVAAALLLKGIPAVLAMNFAISDQAALAFSETLYRRLAIGDPIESAMVEARLAIWRLKEYTEEWSTPILFMRGSDGHLFGAREHSRSYSDDISEQRRLIELSIPMRREDFGADLQSSLQFDLASFLKLPPNAIRIIAIEKDCLKIVLELPATSAEVLIRAHRQNASKLRYQLLPLTLADVRDCGLSPFDHDVFISHGQSETEWVQTTLLPRLASAGLSVITENQFTIGRPVVMEIERAVLTSRKTIVVISTEYITNRWRNFELTLAQTLDPAAIASRTLPIVRGSCNLPLRLAALVSIDMRDANPSEEKWQRLIAAAAGYRVASPLLPGPTIKPPSPLPRLHWWGGLFALMALLGDLLDVSLRDGHLADAFTLDRMAGIFGSALLGVGLGFVMARFPRTGAWQGLAVRLGCAMLACLSLLAVLRIDGPECSKARISDIELDLVDGSRRFSEREIINIGAKDLDVSILTGRAIFVERSLSDHCGCRWTTLSKDGASQMNISSASGVCGFSLRPPGSGATLYLRLTVEEQPPRLFALNAMP